MKIEVNALWIEKQVTVERVGVLVKERNFGPPDIPQVLESIKIMLGDYFAVEVQEQRPGHYYSQQGIDTKSDEVVPSPAKRCRVTNLRCILLHWAYFIVGEGGECGSALPS